MAESATPAFKKQETVPETLNEMIQHEKAGIKNPNRLSDYDENSVAWHVRHRTIPTGDRENGKCLTRLLSVIHDPGYWHQSFALMCQLMAYLPIGKGIFLLSTFDEESALITATTDVNLTSDKNQSRALQTSIVTIAALDEETRCKVAPYIAWTLAAYCERPSAENERKLNQYMGQEIKKYTGIWINVSPFIERKELTHMKRSGADNNPFVSVIACGILHMRDHPDSEATKFLRQVYFDGSEYCGLMPFKLLDTVKRAKNLSESEVDNFLNALAIPSLQAEVKGLQDFVSKIRDLEGRDSGMWRYARILESGFFEELQFSRSKILSAALAAIVDLIKGTTGPNSLLKKTVMNRFNTSDYSRIGIVKDAQLAGIGFLVSLQTPHVPHGTE